MTRGKRIALVLGVGAGVLALFAIAQQAGLGTGYRLLTGGEPAAVPQFTGLEREALKLEPYTEYGDIVARPVFNETRLPEATVESEATGDAANANASPLNVTLTGVIITPGVKLAFVRDNVTNTVQRVKVGNPLEGEQSGWKLVELKARGAVFEGAGLGRQDLELSTDTKGASGVPVAAAPAAPPGAAPVQPVPGQPAQPEQLAPQPNVANADEIRRRIEERRRQLREEAQRMMQEQNKQ